MLRRFLAVALLSVASFSFALRFRPPPQDRFELDAFLAEVEILVAEEAEPEPPQVTRRTFTPLTTAPTTTLPPLPPGVREFESAIVRFGRGSLQLKIRLDLGELVDIEMIRTPHSSERAFQINTDTHPILRAQAIELQDYRVDIVSGATETTYGWARALRDALEQADFCVNPKCDLPLK